MNSHKLAEVLLGSVDKEVRVFWDGAARGGVEAIVESNDELIIVGEWPSYDAPDLNGNRTIWKNTEPK